MKIIQLIPNTNQVALFITKSHQMYSMKFPFYGLVEAMNPESGEVETKVVGMTFFPGEKEAVRVDDSQNFYTYCDENEVEDYRLEYEDQVGMTRTAARQTELDEFFDKEITPTPEPAPEISDADFLAGLQKNPEDGERMFIS